jgi:hypothetical protein
MPSAANSRANSSLQTHLESDPLVKWGWDAGTDPQGRRREPPPVPYAEFIEAVREWTRLGTPCPKT